MIGFIIGGIAVVLFGIYKGFSENKEENIIYNPSPVTYPTGSDTLYIFNEINEIRNSKGLKPLTTDDTTTILAVRRNKEMVEQNELSHKLASDEFGELLTLGADSVGEIIARKYREPEAVIKAWVKSDGHYNQIISEKYDWCGVSVRTDKDGVKWYCVIFGNEDEL